MNMKPLFALSALAALAVLAPRVTAADVEVKSKVNDPKIETEVDLNRDQNHRDKVRHINKASGLIGMEVHNHQHQKLGEIKDLVMDIHSGKLSYAVLAVGGFLGIGEKLIALPPGALRASEEGSYLLLNADKARIQAAPGFAATAWPRMNDPEIDRFWRDVRATGAPAAAETDRGNVDLDTKKKIYTDADEDKETKPKKNDVDPDRK